MLTHARLLELLHYDPETGVFTWRVGRRGAAKAGTVAGGVNGDEYVQIRVLGTRYKAHRLVWFYVHGEWPAEYLDHINMDRSDNRLVNLRQATPGENKCNSRARSDNTSGVKGLRLHTQKLWQADVRRNGIRRTKYFALGNREAAIEWLRTTRQALHGEFANHGT